VERRLAQRKNRHFFSINRAFTPGMQKLGTMAWTGDIEATWEELKKTVGYILNWGLAGNAYTTCDIGGFQKETNALLLLRWYQLGVFLPLMRIHSTLHVVPHFPFLWETKEEMRQAMLLRERLIPYHYTLAHRLSQDGELLCWPMAALYPETHGMDMTSQFMDGPSNSLLQYLLKTTKQWSSFPKDIGTLLSSATRSNHRPAENG